MVKHSLFITAAMTCILTACEIPLGGFFVGDSSVNTRFEESMELNRIKPHSHFTLSADNYSVLLCADLHLQTETRRFSRFLESASNAKYLFSSILGDYMYELGASSAPIIDSLEGRSVVCFIPVIGNHEVYRNSWDDYKRHFGSSVYHFSVKGGNFQDLFLVLDTGSGTMGQRQLEWLKTTLPKLRASHRRCVVFTHNNFFRPSGSLGMTALLPQEELFFLLDLFARQRVDLVVTGHDHKHDVTKMKGVCYISLAAMRQEIETSEMCELSFDSEGKISYTFIDTDL